MKEKFKLTSLERKWVMYDVGNSAFTLMVSTLIPIYFNMLASETGLDSVTYLAYWGYAITVSTLIVVVLGPVLGAISDKKARKKPIFIAVILLGAAGCLSMGFTKGWKSFLIVFVIARVFYQISLIIYDSMLGDVTTEDRLDEVSSQGYAWGYIGSVVPFIICLVLFIFSGKLGMTQAQALAVAFVITAVWWASVSVPLFRSYEQKNYVNERESHENLFVQLWATLKDMAKTPQILLFVLAFFFYIDGVYTIIDMSTAYGAALGLDSTGLLLALLVTQFVAFPSVLIIGRLSRTIAPEKLITVCIIAYFGIAMFAVFMSAQIHFWILAVCVGIFQGGIQALSRSYFTKIIPSEKSGEYFGFLDICGKGASIMGTLVMSALTQITGKQQIGVGAIACFFIVGLVLFRMSAAKAAKKQ